MAFERTLLSGRRILVTGGGSGLGKAMALSFAELGANVVICGRRVEKLENVADEAMQRGLPTIGWHACDLRDAAQVDVLLASIFADAPLDGLVNNAAANFVSPSESLSPRALDGLLAISLNATCYTSIGVGRRWIESQRRGAIVNVAATTAWTGFPFAAASAVAKAGVVALTQSLAVEWGSRGIRTNAIAPGPLLTGPASGKMFGPVPIEQQVPVGRAGQPKEVADLVAFLLSDLAGFINGECVAIDGGWWLQQGGARDMVKSLYELTPEQWQAMRGGQK
jgi:NAD(P)-dependent dehydrogenase (short-subunit alcohol dehydrogenase family)